MLTIMPLGRNPAFVGLPASVYLEFNSSVGHHCVRRLGGFILPGYRHRRASFFFVRKAAVATNFYHWRDMRLPFNRSGRIEIEVGAKLRELRIQAGMSQSELGTAMGVSHTQVQKYEQGRNRMAVSTLVRICEILGASPMDFLDPYFRGRISNQPERPPPSLRLQMWRKSKARRGA